MEGTSPTMVLQAGRYSSETFSFAIRRANQLENNGAGMEASKKALARERSVEHGGRIRHENGGISG